MQFHQLKRREFIICSAAWLRGHSLRAQQAAMPVIGFLRSLRMGDRAHIVTPFHRGLREAGYIDGSTVAIAR
jgi:hypothetical protein